MHIWLPLSQHNHEYQKSYFCLCCYCKFAKHADLNNSTASHSANPVNQTPLGPSEEDRHPEMIAWLVLGIAVCFGLLICAVMVIVLLCTRQRSPIEKR